MIYYHLAARYRFIKEHRLVVSPKGMITLSQQNAQLLESLAKRPLFSSDVPKNSKLLSQKILEAHQARYSNDGYKLYISLNFKSASKSKAQFVGFQVEKRAVLLGAALKKNLGEGFYLLPWSKELKIVGAKKLCYFSWRRLTDLRDEWILKEIRKCSPKRLVDLGCGKSGRLLSKLPSTIDYLGIDKVPPAGDQFITADITKVNYPSLKAEAIILEEVIEHLRYSAALKLLHQLIELKPKLLIITTPNKSFTNIIPKKIRHPDHHFEFYRQELERQLSDLKSRYDFSYKIIKIGKPFKGVTPTWGIKISFL